MTYLVLHPRKFIELHLVLSEIVCERHHVPAHGTADILEILLALRKFPRLFAVYRSFKFPLQIEQILIVLLP